MDYWGISPWLLLFGAPFLFCAVIWVALRVVLALGPTLVGHLRPDEHPGRLRSVPGRWWGLPGFAGGARSVLTPPAASEDQSLQEWRRRRGE